MSSCPQIYRIYSHADADGGIASALFSRFLSESWGKKSWIFDIHPVNHGTHQTEWSLREISFPCSILDFTLHPSFLSERFFSRDDTENKNYPPCYWIDHHPTGSAFPFLTPDNLPEIMPHVRSIWDCSAISTPGLMRTHHEKLGIPRRLIENFEEYIDIAEIIDGALYSSAESAHDFESIPVRVQVLFSPSHPAIDKFALYRRLVRQILEFQNIEDFLDCDPIFNGIIEYERSQFLRQLGHYRSHTRKEGLVAVADFSKADGWEGLGRFIPYLLFPDVQYALHIGPKHKGASIISCGINPWNKPLGDERHLGNFFARHLGGGGHSFVAGGRMVEDNKKIIRKLLRYLNTESDDGGESEDGPEDSLSSGSFGRP